MIIKKERYRDIYPYWITRGNPSEYRRSNIRNDDNDSITNDDDNDNNSNSVSGNPNRKQLE